MKITNCIREAGFKGSQKIEDFVFPSVDCYSYRNPVDRLIYQFILKSAEKYFDPEHNRIIEGPISGVDGIHILNPDNNIALEIFMWCGYPVISMVSYPSYIDGIEENSEGPFIADIENMVQQRIKYFRTNILTESRTLLYAIVSSPAGASPYHLHYRMATLDRMQLDDYIEPIRVFQFLNCITKKFLERRNYEPINNTTVTITPEIFKNALHAFISEYEN